MSLCEALRENITRVNSLARASLQFKGKITGMVSRCCNESVEIMGTENQYYACLECGLPCMLTAIDDSKLKENGNEQG